MTYWRPDLILDYLTEEDVKLLMTFGLDELDAWLAERINNGLISPQKATELGRYILEQQEYRTSYGLGMGQRTAQELTEAARVKAEAAKEKPLWGKPVEQRPEPKKMPPISEAYPFLEKLSKLERRKYFKQHIREPYYTFQRGRGAGRRIEAAEKAFGEATGLGKTAAYQELQKTKETYEPYRERSNVAHQRWLKQIRAMESRYQTEREKRLKEKEEERRKEAEKNRFAFLQTKAMAEAEAVKTRTTQYPSRYAPFTRWLTY